MGYNRVVLLGHLTREPQWKSGIGVCSFGMAINRSFVDPSGNKKEEVTFVDVEMWGKRGEAFATWHKKGDQAFVEGRLRYQEWTDKETDQKRSKLIVVAETFEFVIKSGTKSDSKPSPQRKTARDAQSSESYEEMMPSSDDVPF